jgi:hypothetical protein
MDMARFLAPAGEVGRSQMILEHMGARLPEALAIGDAGTVYLMPRSRIVAAHRASWRSRPWLWPSPIASIVRTTPIRPWRSPFAEHCCILRSNWDSE